MDFICGCSCRYLACIMYVYMYIPEEYKDTQQDVNCASLHGRIMAAFDFLYLFIYFHLKIIYMY